MPSDLHSLALPSITMPHPCPLISAVASGWKREKARKWVGCRQGTSFCSFRWQQYLINKGSSPRWTLLFLTEFFCLSASQPPGSRLLPLPYKHCPVTCFVQWTEQHFWKHFWTVSPFGRCSSLCLSRTPANLGCWVSIKDKNPVLSTRLGYTAWALDKACLDQALRAWGWLYYSIS